MRRAALLAAACGAALAFAPPTLRRRRSRRDAEASVDKKAALRAEATSWSPRKGDACALLVDSFGPLGAACFVHPDDPKADPAAAPLHESEYRGLVYQSEISLARARRGGEDIVIGDEMDGWVQNVRDDGKLDITLRPLGYAKVAAAQDLLLQVRLRYYCCHAAATAATIAATAPPVTGYSSRSATYYY